MQPPPHKIKVWCTRKADPVNDGLKQVDSYLKRLGVNFGWLVIFDLRKNARSLEERLKTEVTTTKNGCSITIVRA